MLLPCRTQMNLAWQWHCKRTAMVSNVEFNSVTLRIGRSLLCWRSVVLCVSILVWPDLICSKACSLHFGAQDTNKSLAGVPSWFMCSLLTGWYILYIPLLQLLCGLPLCSLLCRFHQRAWLNKYIFIFNWLQCCILQQIQLFDLFEQTVKYSSLDIWYAYVA